MLDIYFDHIYGKMCELIDGGECCRYVLNTKSGQILNQYIKRPVPFLIDGVQYYDAVTPYGYGGPVVIDANDKEELINDYQKDFAAYCTENKIICEFVRYHPIVKNYEDFASVYENTYSRHTIGTNLKQFEDPVQSEFSKNARWEVRKAEKAGVCCIVNERPQDLSVFRKLYEETMTRNHAGAMYFFPDRYYEILTTELRESVLEIQAILDNEIVASEIYFVSGGIMHAHLLGSSSKLLTAGGGAIIEATAARWGKANGFDYIHHGGGRTSDEDDPLYLYKKKFGKQTKFDFYVGKKIWNQKIFDQAVEIRKSEGEIANPGYFPIYRG